MEGHYKFHFQNNLTVDQFYIMDSRKFGRRESIDDIINSTDSKQIHIPATSKPGVKNTWRVSEPQMASSFRYCLRYNRMEYKTRELKTSVECKLPEHKHLKCSFRDVDGENIHEIAVVNISTIASESKKDEVQSNPS